MPGYNIYVGSRTGRRLTNVAICEDPSGLRRVGNGWERRVRGPEIRVCNLYLNLWYRATPGREIHVAPAPRTSVRPSSQSPGLLLGSYAFCGSLRPCHGTPRDVTVWSGTIREYHPLSYSTRHSFPQSASRTLYPRPNMVENMTPRHKMHSYLMQTATCSHAAFAG